MTPEQTLPPADLRSDVEAIRWYHCLELAPGLVTPGMFDLRPYVQHYRLPDDLTGMRVLDVGTFDGFWSFELERRGAAVTALDIDRIQEMDWPPRLRPADDRRRGEGFALASEAFGSSVERVALSVYDATPERLGGTFDLVFCGTMLIHLRDPMLALERMVALCHGQLVSAEEYSRRLRAFPFVHAAEFRGESPWMTWWRPAPRTWRAMIRCAGFEDVQQVGRFVMRRPDGTAPVPHVVFHARGSAERPRLG